MLPDLPMQRILQSFLLREIRDAAAEGADTFYSGLATGIDLIAAELVLAERQQHPHLRLIGVKPFPQQGNSLDAELRARYQAVEQAADEIICVSSHYHQGCFSMRNQYMIDHSSRLIAVVKEMQSGTGQTIRMAQKAGLTLRIIDINQLESAILPPDDADLPQDCLPPQIQGAERNF